jgi:hypothetical protein
MWPERNRPSLLVCMSQLNPSKLAWYYQRWVCRWKKLNFIEDMFIERIWLVFIGRPVNFDSF